MPFELFIPRNRPDMLKSGECSLDMAGNLRIPASDLHRAGIRDRAAVLVDKTTNRIAVRAPADSDPFLAVKPNKAKTVSCIKVRGALTAIGLAEPGQYKGRRPLMQKDNLLIVQLR